MLGIVRTHFDEIAVIARNMMDFKDFGAVRERLGNRLVRRSLVTPDGNERKQAQPERFGVDLRAITPDDAPRFELSDTLEHRGWGQAHGASNIDLSFSGIRLKLIEDLKIYRVESLFDRHDRIISTG
jgi:hypothetical protein